MCGQWRYIGPVSSSSFVERQLMKLPVLALVVILGLLAAVALSISV